LNNIAIEGRYGERLVTLLEAHRLGVHGLLPQSLAHGGLAALRDRKNETPTRAIAGDLQRSARELTGREFLALSELLKSISPSPQTTASARHGEVMRTFDKGLVIRDNRREYYASEQFCNDFANTNEGDAVSFVARRGNRPGSWLARKVSRR